MRKRAAFLAGAGSAAIVAIGWSMGAQAIAAQTAAQTAATAGTSSSTSNTASSNSSTSSSSSSSSSSGSNSSSSSSSSTSGVKNGTFTGSVVDTGRYGTVQVKAVISGGKITDVVAVKLTDADPRSVDISSQVAPLLKQEVVSAQSANVSNISGGTYTTQAYLQSLQSALDQAGFKG